MIFLSLHNDKVSVWEQIFHITIFILLWPGDGKITYYLLYIHYNVIVN